MNLTSLSIVIDLRFLELSLHRHVKNFDRAHPGWAAVNWSSKRVISRIALVLNFYKEKTRQLNFLSVCLSVCGL